MWNEMKTRRQGFSAVINLTNEWEESKIRQKQQKKIVIFLDEIQNKTIHGSRHSCFNQSWHLPHDYEREPRRAFSSRWHRRVLCRSGCWPFMSVEKQQQKNFILHSLSVPTWRSIISLAASWSTSTSRANRYFHSLSLSLRSSHHYRLLHLNGNRWTLWHVLADTQSTITLS